MGPSKWYVISETMIDFTNILINNQLWNCIDIFNPKKEIPLFSTYENEEIPIKEAKEIMFKLPLEDTYIDGYINDLLTIIIYSNDLILRGIHTVPSLCYILFRPVHENEPVTRTDIIGTEKLKAEGNLNLEKVKAKNSDKEFLALMSINGASIPNITYALSDCICWSDASSFGLLGGFNYEGLAWQLEIHEDLRFRVSINSLEFITSVVTIMLTLENKEKDIKILLFTDNSSALGWLYKASFHPASQMSHNKVARKFARFMMKEGHYLYSEHIKGDSNNIADALSREFSFLRKKLTKLLYGTICTNHRCPRNSK